MKKIASFVLSLVLFTSGVVIAQTGDYKIIPVPFNKVYVDDGFWTKRIKTNKEVTIPIAFGYFESIGRVNNFKIAVGLMKGKFQSGSPFDGSDVSKIIEGAAYSLSSSHDLKLEAYVDALICFMGKTQGPDGYLYIYRTIMGNDSHLWIGSKRWEITHILSHELYNLRHMYEATGKRSLLDISLKSADLVAKDSDWNALKSYPGHQEIEIDLAKLYKVTGNKKYLDLAKYFLDVREKAGFEGNTYAQSHLPVVEQDEAVDHSFRALYIFPGMADVAALSGDKSYVEASNFFLG